ncbi:MAG: tetratricopeptide repeat protein [Thermodesulfovibrionia bacterium]|nr:tetratricopeptide repeat protein [Thermodesulfovibrionia bacterium]
MGKIIILFILIFISALGMLAFLNSSTVSVTVWQGTTFKDIPIIAVILMSTAIGFFSMFIVTIFRDAKRFIDNWQEQRSQKEEQKIEQHYAKGLNAFHASRLNEAAELLKRINDEEPKHANAFLRLGDVYFKKGDLVSARDYYAKAAALKPRDIETLMSLERVFEKEQKWQDALKYLNRVLDIDEGNLMALRKKRDIFDKTRRWDDVIDVQGKILKGDLSADEIINEEDTLLGYRYELCRQQITAGNSDKAVKALRSIIKADKDFIAAHIALAETCLEENQDDDAIDILINGYQTTSSLVFLARLEDLFLSIGEPGRIIDFYMEAAEKNAADPRIQFLLAKLYYRLEMIDDALQTLNNIDFSVFDSPDIHVLLGNIYQRRSQYEQAAEEFKKALKVDKPIVIPFCCSKCAYTSKKWAGRCPECKSWNTLAFDLNGACKK